MDNLGKITEEVEEDVEEIMRSEHSVNLEKYIEKRMPIFYPNKGLIYMFRKGATVEVYHEQFNLTRFLKRPKGETIETVIDYYGSTHQRDYCCLVFGHRFQGKQLIQFRGILGKARLYKILLMLRLIGVPKQHLLLYDKCPNYREIICHDLSSLRRPIDYAIIGGDVIIKPFVSTHFTPVRVNRGEIISYTLYQYNRKWILFTSYPYGELCEYVIESLKSRIKEAILFLGSAGSLSPRLSIGDIFLPLKIYCGLHTSSVSNLLNYLTRRRFFKLKVSRKHTSVKTPLVETMNFIENLKANGYESIDSETAYFQRGCREFLSKEINTGILLFVSDKPGSSRTLGEHDYSSNRILDVRRRLAHLTEIEIRASIGAKNERFDN